MGPQFARSLSGEKERTLLKISKGNISPFSFSLVLSHTACSCKWLSRKNPSTPTVTVLMNSFLCLTPRFCTCWKKFSDVQWISFIRWGFWFDSSFQFCHRWKKLFSSQEMRVSYQVRTPSALANFKRPIYTLVVLFLHKRKSITKFQTMVYFCN